MRADTKRKGFNLLESGICHVRRERYSEYAFLIEEPLTYTVAHRYISKHAVKETKHTVMRVNEESS
jgi:hypothetical protein